MIEIFKHYSTMYVFHEKVKVNVKLLQKVKHQKTSKYLKDNGSSCSLAKNAKMKFNKFVDFYGKIEKLREVNLRAKTTSAFKDYFSNLKETQIHIYNLCKFSMS